MTDFEEIAALYDVPKSLSALLVGGPCDGQEHQVAMGGRKLHDVLMALLFSFRVPLPPPISIRPLDDEATLLACVPMAEYGLLLDDVSQPSRDDRGRVRLGFRGTW